MIDDLKLPGLKQALDDEQMLAVLPEVLDCHANDGGPGFNRVTHQILKHKPGKHCVIQYWLGSNGNGENVKSFIGKLYRHNRGERNYANLLKLWNASRGNGSQQSWLGMSEPLAYLPDLGMVLQSVVPGRQLSGFSERDDLAHAVRCVAHNLSVLHGLRVDAAEKKTINDHIEKKCHPGPRVLMEACPELTPLVEGILNELAEREKYLQGVPPCPVHGDLGLSQIFISADRAFFIDFDGFCLSHAALDTSNFLIALKVHFAPQSEALTRVFLAAYLQRQSREMLAGQQIYQALIYLRRAMICFRLQAHEDWCQHTRQFLEAGNAALRASGEFDL
jgi:hypothetical protein